MRAFHLIRHLAQRHSVTLLAFGDRPRGGGVPSGVSLRVIPPTPIDRANLGIRGLLSPVPRHLVQNESLTMHQEVARHMGGCDIAIGMQLDAARYLERWTTIPRVFEEAELAVIREQFEHQTRHDRRARKWLTWTKTAHFVQRLVARFDRTTVVSDAEREHLGAAGCDTSRVAVIPNGTDIPPTVHDVGKQDRLIYPGAVTYSANLDAMRFFVADIFPLVRRARPGVELWITGETGGVDLSALRVPGVRFTGHLAQVEPVIAESAVCIIPLRLGGGTRLKALQAMALRVPVVSTRKGVEGLDVEPGRHVVIADNPAEFAAQILRVCDDNALRQQIVEAADRFVRERHAWPVIGAALERVLESAVDAHRAEFGEPRRSCASS